MGKKPPFFKRRAVRIIMIVLLTGLIAGAAIGYRLYNKVFLSNVKATVQDASVFIDGDDNLDSLVLQMDTAGLLKDISSFKWWAEKRYLNGNMHRGHYLIHGGMTNRDLLNLFASGRQQPVNVTFNNIRTKEDFAKRIAEQLEPSEKDFKAFFDTTALFAGFGLTKDNFMTLFIPNTYELYWTSSVENFVLRMKKEHDAFWTEARKTRAKNLNLTPEEVYILASIVYSENEKASDEAPRIAGVYLNRLEDNWNLEADPTVKFAIGDFAKKRIYLSDLEIDSPYNTYKYPGLPPGPIHMPPIVYIDAVLNYEHHEYMFMCARGDGSGYHYFAKTLAEHNRNSILYHKALDSQGIR